MKYIEDLFNKPGAKVSVHPDLNEAELGSLRRQIFQNDPKASKSGGTTVATFTSWHEALHAGHPAAGTLLDEMTKGTCKCLRCGGKIGAGRVLPDLVLVRSTAKPKLSKNGRLRGWKDETARVAVISDECRRKHGLEGIGAWVAENLLPGVKVRRTVG
ncbi:hypothetical protein [Aliiruegeria lutimaris]|uniref:Uncharacterized protein n=1 Tax=Aliiruegeria lutimaris TaxID=571298 RepID=A0A1G9AJF0_9RHOB|nr:hypothetical protein [Aliiruegeria lutimaris]SDK27398.1 hypothetical protein SAMN04488026_10366 [Aliiruegeria lutimaris]